MSGFMIGPIGVLPSGGGGTATAQGVFFDGTVPTYLSRASAPAGVVDGHSFTLSFWFRMNGASGDSTFQIIFETLSNKGLFIQRDNLNKWTVGMNDASFQNVVCGSNNTYSSTSNPGWHHLYCSLDNTSTTGGGGTLGDLYIDGTLDRLGYTQNTGASMAFTEPSLTLGARSGGTLPLYADIAAFWLKYNSFNDPATSANIQKFRSIGGSPVNLGSDGSTPFGFTPDIYFNNSPSTWQNNLGTGGNFTVTSGTLTASSTNPP